MKIAKAVQAVLLLTAPLMSCGQTTTIYSYSVPQGGYDGASNLLNYSDSVNGAWSMQYDNLNRLQNATGSGGVYNGLTLQWTYDSFGNRTSQTPSGNVSAPAAISATYDANNRIKTTTVPGVDSTSYDAAGNLRFDGQNSLVYDAENRVCADYNSNTGQTTQYLYNAEGQRVAKGHSKSNPGTLVCMTDPSDFTATETYVLGQGGEQVSQVDGSNAWQHTNVYAAGELIATYDQEDSQKLLHFNLSDPLGTKRVQASAAGVVELNYSSLPYGDGLNTAGSGQDATPHHFTGKQRDTESGLDYFGARYYGSATGRWMSPDWAEKPEAVPYSDLTNPQSLNLYGYVRNNPLSRMDKDGHDGGALEMVLTAAAVAGVAEHVMLAHARSKVIAADQELLNTDYEIVRTASRQPEAGLQQVLQEIPRVEQDQRNQSVSLAGDVLNAVDGAMSLVGKVFGVKVGSGPKDPASTAVQQTEKNLKEIVPALVPKPDPAPKQGSHPKPPSTPPTPSNRPEETKKKNPIRDSGPQALFDK